jgi:hypothetical protein
LIAVEEDQDKRRVRVMFSALLIVVHGSPVDIDF